MSKWNSFSSAGCKLNQNPWLRRVPKGREMENVLVIRVFVPKYIKRFKAECKRDYEGFKQTKQQNSNFPLLNG